MHANYIWLEYASLVAITGTTKCTIIFCRIIKSSHCKAVGQAFFVTNDTIDY